jgi:site-specific DNA-methyltransferase (cytosine-N4-specific)
LVAEGLGRKWKAFEMSREYLAASSFRFHKDADDRSLRRVYEAIIAGQMVDITRETATLPFAAE